jgi:DNA-directed RNA polymerase beta subunit
MTTDTNWSHEFETLRRENLFRNPPKDHTAYPALVAAVQPHIDSFNALLEKDGLIAQALRDIGTKTYLDGDERAPSAGKNKLSISIKEIFVEKSQLPALNKFSTKNREILPAECRERHVSYRGKMSARLEYKINNGDPKEFMRELGQLPIMLKVRSAGLGNLQILISKPSQTDVTWKTILQQSLYIEKKRQKSWVDISWSTESRRSSDFLLSIEEISLWPSSDHPLKIADRHSRNLERQ